MKKTMYSLMLSQDIVNEIDKLAYANSTNRSNMINRILAEYLSKRTPEMRLSDMFDFMEGILSSSSDTLQVMLRNSQTMLSLRSPLEFKYNPTVKYNVELYRSSVDIIGELRVGLRTQNSSLMLCMTQFYKLWVKIENKYLLQSEYSISDGKFCKKFILKGGNEYSCVSDEDISKGIVDYIMAFDSALKTFLYHINSPSKAVIQVESVYAEYLSAAKIRF